MKSTKAQHRKGTLKLIDDLFALDAAHPYLGQTAEPVPDKRPPPPPKKKGA